MGQCHQSAELQPGAETDRKLGRELAVAHRESEMYNTILLLGPENSGKSTITKQLIAHYGKGWDTKDRMAFKEAIHRNIVTTVKSMLLETELKSAELEASKKVLLDLGDDAVIDEKVARHIEAVWGDDEVKSTFEKNARGRDGMSWYLERIHEIGKESYVPSEEDVLRTRARTSRGIVEINYNYDGNHFKLYDVGDQRNNRKKWIHCFDKVNMMIFVASLNSFDQSTFGDTNQLLEAIELFDEACNSKSFRDVPVSLLLNKRDLFQEKLRRGVPLTVCFPEYKGANTYEDAAEYIWEKFMERVRNGKTVFRFVTCATDKHNMSVVVQGMTDIVMRQQLCQSG